MAQESSQPLSVYTAECIPALQVEAECSTGRSGVGGSKGLSSFLE